MVLTLYKLEASPPVRAVLMTIEALKIPNVKYVNINTLEGDHKKPEFLKLNPQHTIPTLTDDDFVIWDSHAITAYLVTKYGKDDSLYPTDPKKRAIVDQRLHFDSGVLFILIRESFNQIVYDNKKQLSPEFVQQFKNAYDFTNTFLTNDWLAGDKITLADICCVASISTLDTIVPIDHSAYPKLSAWLKRASQQDFYKKENVLGLEQFRDVIQSKLQG